jgi:hypothetical protein
MTSTDATVTLGVTLWAGVIDELTLLREGAIMASTGTVATLGPGGLDEGILLGNEGSRTSKGTVFLEGSSLEGHEGCQVNVPRPGETGCTLHSPQALFLKQRTLVIDLTDAALFNLLGGYRLSHK